MTAPDNSLELCSRRAFLTTSALGAAALSLPRAAFALAPSRASVTVTAHPVLPGHEGPGLSITSHHGSSLHATTHAPQALAAHPSLPVVYAAFAGSDPAHLAAYTISSGRPLLRQTSAQAVALAASHPCALAVTPGAGALLTLDHHGLLTLHPLLPDGSIAPVQHLRRLTGSPRLPGSLSRPTHLWLSSAGRTALLVDPTCHRVIPVDLTSPDGPRLLPERPLASAMRRHPAGSSKSVTLIL